MKKLLSLVLALVMCLGLLSACGDTPEKPVVSESTENGNEAVTDSTDPVNIVLLINGTLGDKSFFDSAENGMQLIKEKYGDAVELRTVEMSYDATKWTPTLIEFSEDDETDIIISGTWQMVDRVAEVAPDYPEKKYIVYDASMDYTTGDYGNVYSILYKQNEGSFLAGAAAAMASETGVFGFVGGMDNVTINDFLVGLIEGAQYINPDMKFAVAYIGNFDDAVKCKEITLSQISNQKADVVYGCAGQAGLGNIEAAAENGVYSIGGDSDQAMILKESNEDKASCIITSIMKRVDMSLLKAVSDYMEGSLEWGTAGELGLNDQAVGLAKNEYYEAILTEEQRAQIDEIEQKIIDGEITVGTAFGMTTEEIEALRNSVQP